ncbi:lysophospholipid acyltransferase family protein [Lentzea jiangxiensis]|uniref:1-acyl-sn-glycerol-3-phosphate acyltransferases n=1 Tax=Lentzea jiangxiensis TaxID=641025 RepID=A0A1H0WQR6_9PSEU|nr:lysophospholipid acyltransferase family protein [Lentzea jiangxiensis]SDP92962.1 1-acyl-sn-glycerol-3-phosphate acyltransferases [Lentzea jiangxiensis]
MTPLQLAAWTWKIPRRGRGFWFSLAIDVLWPVVVLFVRLRVRGRHHVPGNGGVVLAFNHLSNADAVAAVVFALLSNRVPRVLAKASLWRLPLFGRVMRSGGHIPVERGTVKASEALKPAVEALRAGRCVMAFPEGTFTNDPDGWPMKGKSGVARMALEARVPVVPVAEWGTQDLLPRGSVLPRLLPRKRIEVVAGAPVDLSDLYDRELTAEVLDEATSRVMDAITTMLSGIRSAGSGSQGA